MVNKFTLCVPLCIVFALLLAPVLFSNNAFSLETHQGIRGPFTSSMDVTGACLKCHHQQALEVLQSTHWTWIRQRSINGKSTLFGKKDSLTGFAVDVSSNPSRCMGCHISNTRPNVNLDAPGPEMVDCLICHDTTGIYRHYPPEKITEYSSEELEMMARNVGTPAPSNCMTCHFADCGLPDSDGTAVNYRGNTSAMQDFHMMGTKTSFNCQTCHVRHSGHGFSRKIGNKNGAEAEQGCKSCHTAEPHTIGQLNQHLSTVACQTCHIPRYAQQDPVIISWNWIMTGKTNRVYQNRTDSRALVQDENGFTSATQLEPVYLWDDGNDLVYTRGQRIKPQELTYLQRPSEKSSQSKITPFRVIYGTQMYDSKYRYLISPLLYPTGTTYFPDSDWENIAQQGMKAIVLPFSGQYAFAPTATYKRISHGIVPAGQALGCVDCHGSRSRMPWEKLGYEKDPWPGNTQASIEQRNDEKKLNPATLAKLQPVKKLIKPLGSSF